MFQSKATLLLLSKYVSISTHRSIIPLTSRHMTTAYSGIAGDGKLGIDKLPYNLPISKCLPKSNGRKVEISPFEQHEWDQGMKMMNHVIQEGRAWPFEDEYKSIDSYRSYFLSHAAFVIRATEPGLDIHNHPSSTGDILGCFYIKPNFPGRCSHICNGGFITDPRFQSLGVGSLMGQAFLRLAKDLGYQSSYFNLVFQSNVASVRLWESLGFERVAVLEKAARLKGLDYLDTAYGYRFDLTKLSDDYFIN